MKSEYMNDIENLTNFQFVWENWIEPLADDIYNQISKDFIDRCNVEKRNMAELRKGAERYYKERRKALKINFYGKDYEEEWLKPHRMDFHKLSSILCRTLIEYKIFDFDVAECEKMAAEIDKTDTDWLVKNALVNFRMAFYTSIVFLYQSMLFKYSEKAPEITKALRDKKKLELYNQVQKDDVEGRIHESFENCMVLDLAKRDISNRSFDFLMYATIMYQLEEYNKVLLPVESE